MKRSVNVAKEEWESRGQAGRSEPDRWGSQGCAGPAEGRLGFSKVISLTGEPTGLRLVLEEGVRGSLYALLKQKKTRGREAGDWSAGFITHWSKRQDGTHCGP